jgi:hypothetical protein
MALWDAKVSNVLTLLWKMVTELFFRKQLI